MADMMILVAATALGCGLWQGISAFTDGDLSLTELLKEAAEMLHASRGRSWGPDAIYLCSFLATLSMPLVAMWTLAVIPLRLSGPRPPLRRLARQPGMMAACASVLALSLIGVFITAVMFVTNARYTWNDFAVQETVTLLPMFVGLAVLMSWMSLLIGRRWRAERSWVDRLGRAVGLYWIMAGLTMMCFLVSEEISTSQPFMIPPHLRPAIEGQQAESP